MSGLPEGWESDYDGARWFYRYTPTGIIQYHFPKPGDEFPEYFDSFAPVPDLAPEERLESDRQLKRRSTTDGKENRSSSSSARKNRNNAGPSATLGGPDDGGFGYSSFESFGYLGPGGYTDISPLNEEEEEGKENVAGANNAGEGSSKSAVGSPAGASVSLTPLTSAGTTPNPPNNALTASGAPTPPVEVPAVPAERPDPTAGIPMLHSDALPYELPDAAHMGSSNSHPLAQTPAANPVGFMAELATSATAQCADETAPIELPSNEMLYGHFGVGGAVPVELPHDPVEPKPVVAAVQVADAGSSVNTEAARPALIHQQTAPSAMTLVPAAQVPAEPGAPGQYKPFRAPGVEDTRRSSMVAGDLSKLRGQHPPGIVPGEQQAPPRTDSMSPQPLLVRKSTAPVNMDGALPYPVSPIPSVLKPAANRQPLAHVPSVLKPARGREQSLGPADVRASPGQFRPQPKSYMSGSGNTNSSPERTPARQTAEPPGPGFLQRVNTLPDQLPSQAMLFFPEPRKSSTPAPTATAAVPAVTALRQGGRPHSLSHSETMNMNYRALQPPAELQAPLTQEAAPSVEADSIVVAESRDDEVPQVYNEVLAMVQPVRPEPAQEMSTGNVSQVSAPSQTTKLDTSVPPTPPLFSKPNPFSPAPAARTSTQPTQPSIPTTIHAHHAESNTTASVEASTPSEVAVSPPKPSSQSPVPAPDSISIISSPAASEGQAAPVTTPAPQKRPAEHVAIYSNTARAGREFETRGQMPSKVAVFTAPDQNGRFRQESASSSQPTPPPVPKKIPENHNAQTPPSSFSVAAVESPPVPSPPTPQPQPQVAGAAPPPPAPKPIPATMYVVSRPASTSAANSVAPPPAKPSGISSAQPAASQQQQSSQDGAMKVQQEASAAPHPHANVAATPLAAQINAAQQSWQPAPAHVQHAQIEHGRQHLPTYVQPGQPQLGSQFNDVMEAFGQAMYPPGSSGRPGAPVVNNSVPAQAPSLQAAPGPISAAPPARGPVAAVQSMDSRASSPAPSLKEAVAQPIKRQSAGSIVPIQIKKPEAGQVSPQRDSGSQIPSEERAQGEKPPPQPQFQPSQASQAQNSIVQAPQIPRKIPHEQPAQQASQQAPQQSSQHTSQAMPRHSSQSLTQHPPEQAAQATTRPIHQQSSQQPPQQAHQQPPQMTPQNAAHQGPRPQMSQHMLSGPTQPILQGPPAAYPTQQLAQGPQADQLQQHAALQQQQIAQHYQQSGPRKLQKQVPQQRQGSISNQISSLPSQNGSTTVAQHVATTSQHQRQGSATSQASSIAAQGPVVGPHSTQGPVVPSSQVQPLGPVPAQGQKLQHSQSMPVQTLLQGQTNLHGAPSQHRQSPGQQNFPPQGHQLHHAQTAPLPSQQPHQQAPKPTMPQQPLQGSQNAPSSATPSAPAPQHQRKASMPMQHGSSILQSQPQIQPQLAQTQQQHPPGMAPPSQPMQMMPPGATPGHPQQMQQMPMQMGPGQPPGPIYMVQRPLQPGQQPGMPPQPIMMGQPLPPGVVMQHPQQQMQPGMPMMVYRPGMPQPGQPQPQIVMHQGVPMQFIPSQQPHVAPGQTPINNHPQNQASAAAGQARPNSPTAVKKQGMLSKFFGGSQSAQKTQVPAQPATGGQGQRPLQTAPPQMQGLPGPGMPQSHPSLSMNMQVRPSGPQQPQQMPPQQWQQQPNGPRTQQLLSAAQQPTTGPPQQVQQQKQQAPSNTGLAATNGAIPRTQSGAGQPHQLQPASDAARGSIDQGQRPSLPHAFTVPNPQPQPQAPPAQGVGYIQAPPEQTGQSNFLQPGAAAAAADNVSLLEPDEPEAETAAKVEVPVTPQKNEVAAAPKASSGWGSAVNYDGDDWGDDEYGHY